MSDLNKDFQILLKEDVPQHFPSPGNVEVGLNEKEKVKALDHMNSVFAPLTSTPTVNPYYMVQRIKDRLKMALGLTFDDTYFIGNAGVKEIALSEVEHLNVRTLSNQSSSDNSFLKMFPNGLRIKFHFLKVGNIYHVDAEILPSPELVPATVT